MKIQREDLNVLHYVKNPEPVEAVQLTHSNVDEVARWTGGSNRKQLSEEAYLVVDDDHGLVFVRMDGDHPVVDVRQASIGDWILKDELGRFRAMTDVEFMSSYTIKDPLPLHRVVKPTVKSSIAPLRTNLHEDR